MPPPPEDHPLPYAWLVHELEVLRDLQKDQHQRLREDLNKRFDQLAGDVRAVLTKVDSHTEALLTIQTERKLEKELALGRHTWLISLSAIMGSFATGLLLKAWTAVFGAVGGPVR